MEVGGLVVTSPQGVVKGGTVLTLVLCNLCGFCVEEVQLEKGRRLVLPGGEVITKEQNTRSFAGTSHQVLNPPRVRDTPPTTV